MWHHHGQDFLRQLLLVCGHAKLAFLQMCCKQGFKNKNKKKSPVSQLSILDCSGAACNFAEL